MAPVDLVTIHHEGSLANGGAPSDDVDRFAHGGYCCGLGATRWERWRSPADNWATYQFNGQDWTPCFSGDHHTGTPLRDEDLALLHDAFLDAHARGEVTASPSVVRAHRDSPGSSTACPGDMTMARWADVVAACRADGAPAKPSTPAPPSSGAAPPWPGRYLELASPMMEGDDVHDWQAQMSARGWTISADGIYGPQTDDVCRSFQREKGLGADGIVGPQTWAAAWTAPIT